MLRSQALEKPQLGFRELNEPDLAWLLQPSPKPAKPDFGFAPRLLGIFSGTSPKSVEPDLTLHQSFPDLLRTLRNLLRNIVEPDAAPAPVHTGAILD